MRKIAIFGFVCLLLMSCSNKSIQPGSLYGKWKLTRHYMDIGDGNGQWRNTTNTDATFLEFKEDGTVTHSGPGIQPYSENFRLLNEDSIVFIRNAGDIQMKYELAKEKLTLYPPCIEGCGQEFARVKDDDK